MPNENIRREPKRVPPANVTITNVQTVRLVKPEVLYRPGTGKLTISRIVVTRTDGSVWTLQLQSESPITMHYRIPPELHPPEDTRPEEYDFQDRRGGEE